MAAESIWTELGIAPGADAAAIRRAYAARLKTIRPDTDPQGFARLRNAYERALAAAEAPSKLSSSTPTPGPGPRPPPPPSDPPVTIHEAPALLAVKDCLRRGDLLAAAESLARARAEGALSLADDIRLADQLGWALAQDRSAPVAAVQAAAERLGWVAGRADGRVAAPWAKALGDRLDAEQWLAGLRRKAASRLRWLGASHAVSARLLLGRGKLRTVPSMGRDPTLRRLYGEFLLHAPVIGDQFDPARMEAVARLLTGKAAKPPSVLLLLLGGALIAWAVGMVASSLDPQLQDPVTGIIAIGLFILLFGRSVVRRLRDRRHNRAKNRRRPPPKG